MPSTTGRAWLARITVLAAALLAGCGDTALGVTPVGGGPPSAVESERFARRLHLDLSGRPASDEYLVEAVAALTAEGASPSAARAGLADELLASPDFAVAWVAELENRAFGGEDPDNRYDLICGVIRGDECSSECGEPPGDDVCAGCDCGPLADIAADRAALRSAADDLAAGDATTSEVDRRVAHSTALTGYSEPAVLTDQLFELFLGRPAEADEQVNAESMIFGAIVPGSPAGLLFHRHGSSYDDLVDILFESEVYREAAVSAVFARYLGRRAGLAEMAHFSAELDAGSPDVRPVVRAVVSSQEYFDQ